MVKTKRVESFIIKDCALIQIAAGTRAQNLRELRDRLQTVHPGCIDHHFWGGLVRPRFDDPEYSNDFASWARHGLHDYKLAERLAMIDPAEFKDIEALRQELIDVIEQRLDEGEYLTWANPEQQFQFIRAQTVVFDTGRRLVHPSELKVAIPAMSVSSIYYHFVDARRRPPMRVDDFRAWLNDYSEEFVGLSAALAEVDPYFTTLSELREELTRVVGAYFSSET
ncbi:MAG: DUF5752 family protein [Candidatus Binatia bacterium]